MYEKIKEHILHGHLSQAFEEIGELELSRSQRDELLLLESEYNRFQRDRGTMTVEFQQIAQEKLNRRAIALINRVEDELNRVGDEQKVEAANLKEKVEDLQESIPVVTSGPKIVDARSKAITPRGGIGKTKIPLLIGGGVMMILLAIWAFGFSEKDKPDIGKIVTKPIDKTEQPSEPKEPEPRPPSVGSSKDLKTLPANNKVKPASSNAGFNTMKIDPDQLRTNTDRIVKALQKQNKSVAVFYNKERRILENQQGTDQRFTEKLTRLLGDFSVNDMSAARGIDQALLKSLVTGDYNGGPLDEFEEAYLLFVQVSPDYKKITTTTRVTTTTTTVTCYRTSTGEKMARTTTTVEEFNENTTVKFVADKFDKWVGN